MRTALVTGCNGFIGQHMVMRLLKEGYKVTGIDVKGVPDACAPGFTSSAFRFLPDDLRDFCDVYDEGDVGDVEEVYHFAADMGGIGYITGAHAKIAVNNSRINLNMLEWCRAHQVNKLFYSSSACVYPAHMQGDPGMVGHRGLSEGMAWPAAPEPGYGLEKLYMEELCRYYHHDYNLGVYIARFHNIFGPGGTWYGGKEKAPAALCRKVALAPVGEHIDIWGDGEATRSFLYIDDCIDAVRLLVDNGPQATPLNIGSEEVVTVNQLAQMVIEVSGKQLDVNHVAGPQGVRGRNSDNTKVFIELGWKPKFSLRQGLEVLYPWIYNQATLKGWSPPR